MSLITNCYLRTNVKDKEKDTKLSADPNERMPMENYSPLQHSEYAPPGLEIV
jgi:hypothetical protein